jgi:protein SCO1/2
MKTMTLFLVGSALTTALCTVAADSSPVRQSCCAHSPTSEATPVHLTDKSIYQLDSNWTNDYGAPLKLGSLRGRPQIVTMFFANCAYACPLLVYQMQQIEAGLPEQLRDQVGFTLVSFDTERDTPTALHSYRLNHNLKASRWTLLRGGSDDVLDLAALLNVKFKKDAQGQFNHSNVITLLNAQGEIVYQQLGLSSQPDEMIRQLTSLVSTYARPVAALGNDPQGSFADVHQDTK